jgi:hypothetical protein
VVLRAARFKMSPDAAGHAPSYALPLLDVERVSDKKRVIRAQGLVAGRKLKLDVRLTAGQDGEQRVVVKLKGHALEASFFGRALAEGRNLAGNLSISVPDPRRFDALFTGIPHPWASRGPIMISGALTYESGKWGLDNASFRIANSEGSGFLSLRGVHGRPLLEGTTSWASLAASDFVDQNPGAPDLAKFNNDWRLLGMAANLFDADLRVSSDNFSLTDRSSGPAAAAFSLRSGLLSIDLAELRIFGGTARGRVETDLNRPAPLLVRASMSDANLGALAEAAGVTPLVTGIGDLNIDLQYPRGAGERVEQGKIRISIPEQATLTDGLSRSLVAALSEHGGAMSRIITLPDALTDMHLNADIVNGEALVTVKATLPGTGTAAANGVLDLASKRVKGRMELTPSLAAPVNLAGSLSRTGKPQTALLFHGSLASIQFSSERPVSLSN